ncbi:MAG TPA: FHA domain-containing protein, partial [Pyrinomonadaceae bacterium]
MELQTSKFVINREDRGFDPVTLVTEGLTIGSLPDCELHLNHPTVSEVHAGINQLGGDFYITHLSKSNSTTLNGKLVEGRAAIADGDTVQIGPFVLTLRREGRALRVDVRYLTSVRVGDGAVAGEQAADAIADQI